MSGVIPLIGVLMMVLGYMFFLDGSFYNAYGYMYFAQMVIPHHVYKYICLAQRVIHHHA